MKFCKLTYKHYVSILFCAFIFIFGLLSVIFNFREIFGGLIRGYMDSPEDSSVATKLSNSLTTFDKRMNEYFILHDLSINSYGFIQKSLDKHLIDDADPNYNVVKLKNDYLTFNAAGDSDSSGLKEFLVDLKGTCDNNNVDMLYVNKLGKNTYDKSQVPEFFPFDYVSNFREVKKEMQASGINVLDMDEIVDKEGIDKYSLFYKTDHHWKTKTGLWASNLIADRLNESYDMKIDTMKLDISNYNIETHKDSFLGSQGIRTGEWYTDLEDFDVIYPKYETNMEYEIRKSNIKLKGDFKDTVFYKKSYTDGYGMYMSSRYDLTAFKNLEPNNGKYAVFVVDSFGSVVAPFLAQTFERMDCIDLRYFSDDLGEYIEQNKPDVLIYMVNWTDEVLHKDVI